MQSKMQLYDAAQRELALDIAKSCIVQAPAGSGKTTLLVKRYLKLLAQTKHPENIVAITFTRKAAAEMRERILAALQNPQNPELQLLGQKVLQQDQREQWNLLQNPKRLRIQTIDSLCSAIAAAQPLVAKLQPDIHIASDFELTECYRLAAQEVLEQLYSPESANNIKQLLLYLNNDWQLAMNLFCQMLSKREQWLPYIVALKNSSENLRARMEAGLANIARENVIKCLQLLPQHLRNELAALFHFAKSNGFAKNNSSFLQHIDFKHFSFYIDQTTIEIWQKVAQLLLTNEFNWRARITKEHGFPTHEPMREKETKQLYKEMKQRMQELLEKFSAHEDFRKSLEDLYIAPPPHYTDAQWEIIKTLLEILPLLVAHLTVIFKEKNLCDYAEIAMAADRALGSSVNPTDLALQLDYRIQHLLIDEFQDTSVAQFRLIEKLTAGWQANDGRTLFIVGDPMQSIYRFRDADVGLFLRAQHAGVGQIQLQNITLTTNFRSTQNLVTWINNNFAKILPILSDTSLGAVPFRPSTASNFDNFPAVKSALLVDADEIQEAEHVRKIVQQISADFPRDNIAILVKARSALLSIIPALRNAGIDFQAIELEPLTQSALIQDLFALTRALLHPGDRIAWLAILRAPWCGLQLADLHILANAEHTILWENIKNFANLNLSHDAEQRLANLVQVFTQQLANRGRMTLRDLVEKTWYLLHGPACVAEQSELQNANTFFELLEKNTANPQSIAQALNSLYTNAQAPAKIQLMTIHKAKGLEFEHVIIPGIDRTTKSDAKKLLMWWERPRLETGSDLLLAPLAPNNSDDANPIYQYLRLVEQQKSFYENGRLLYVAITRAKKSVNLIGKIKYVNKKSNIIKEIQKGSLCEQLKSCIDNSWFIPTADDAPITSSVNKHILLSRIAQPKLSVCQNNIIDAKPASSLELPDVETQILGTVIHKVLEQIANYGTQNWLNESQTTKNAYFHKLLVTYGSGAIPDNLAKLKTAIDNTLQDPRGLWILSQHQEAQSEYKISGILNNQLENCAIDRTFIENEVRWIIDYKTSPIASSAQEKQLKKYAKLMCQIDIKREIKLGLYFPLTGEWRELYVNT